MKSKSNNMETKTETLFTVMKVVAWIAFVGLCIEAGAILVSFVFSLIKSPEETAILYKQIKLGDLHLKSQLDYIFLGSLVVWITVLKAYLAYFLIRIFDAITLKSPFQDKVVKLITNLGNTALHIAIVAIFTNLYVTQYLEIRFGLSIPVHFEVSEFLFLAGIIFVLSKIFKRGMEIQSENGLTV